MEKHYHPTVASLLFFHLDVVMVVVLLFSLLPGCCPPGSCLNSGIRMQMLWERS